MRKLKKKIIREYVMITILVLDILIGIVTIYLIIKLLW